MVRELNAKDGLADRVLAAGFDFVTGVPDSGLSHLITELDGRETYLPGTREDNCIALATGAWLAGASPLIFMKSAGLGTCLDALTSLALIYRIPLVLLISWAGFNNRDIPHHNVIGGPAAAVLREVGIPVRQATFAHPDTVIEQLRAARDDAIAGRLPVAVLCVPEDLEQPC